MKRFVKNSIYVIIITAILLVASRTYETPKISSNKIEGDTPFEKTQSLIVQLDKNQEYKDFGRVFLTNIDYQTSTWAYTVTVFYSYQEVGNDQAIQTKYFSLLRTIISQTANFEFVEQVVVLVEFTDGLGIFVSADKEGIGKIREYPDQALLYTQQVPVAMAPIDPDDGNQAGGEGQ